MARTIFTGVGRIIVDLLVLGLWVVFLTLVFLSTGWPPWLFYGLLLFGVGLYVTLTRSWTNS